MVAGRRLVAAVVTAAIGFVAPAAADATGITCQSVTAQVPISSGGSSDYAIDGTLCKPTGSTPSTVQLLVHGGTYDRRYWDWPTQSPYYSYARAAVAAGYATLTVDRLGAGASSHPPSAQVTLDAGAIALHGVVTKLRAGNLGGIAFENVVWVGHSFGSIYAWRYATYYQDIDAYVLTGLLHATKPSWVANALASVLPAGGGLDPGYLTTLPGSRDDLYYNVSAASARVIAADEAMKGTITVPEVIEGSGPPPADPTTADSRSIHVPTMLTIGANDNLYCGPPDGITCNTANVLAAEAPFYSADSQLEVVTVPTAGHSFSLHYAAPAAHAAMLAWVYGEVTPNG
jgi:pimeloyl-ACP methyl ester carboxylesterase